MRALRRAPQSQRGFTLVEMIITALISGMLMVVVARLFLGSYTGWLFNYSSMIAQQKSRIFRDSLIKNVRQAQASTVEVSRFNGNQPPRSMLSFTDMKGKNWVFYQHNNEARMGLWVQSGADRVITSHNVVIPDKLERLIFYHPNAKDMRKLNFAMNMEWDLLADNKIKPVSIHMVGEIEIRDP
jgi:prepilin-type N-terminal cleavage/methylation domain-containing protein